ncbi:MAG: hypothetical protein HYX27_09890 [Acidobacteria bacterium]|nr:hypothetical protein [Acidobacteriota bacterium]
MNNDDLLFQQIAAAGECRVDAPSVLKSRLFSALVQAEAAEGTLMSLSECRARGRDLCVFEHLVAIAPIGEDLKSRNPCRVCHARLLAETFEDAPIWWPGCPYADFQNR